MAINMLLEAGILSNFIILTSFSIVFFINAIILRIARI